MHMIEPFGEPTNIGTPPTHTHTEIGVAPSLVVRGKD
jgi:hypothetical protein